MQYKVKNWERYQHYKNRNPPWIKLHFELLSSKDWVILNDASRVLAVVCMLIASRNEGEIDGSPLGLEYLKRVAHLNQKPNLKPLIDIGFLIPASTMLADASNLHTNAIPEKRRGREEKEGEEDNNSPSVFSNSQFRKLITALKSKNPKAKIDIDNTKQLDSLNKLVTKDGYTEKQVMACLLWVFNSQDKDAEFWSENVSSFIKLRQKKSGDTVTKFDKIFLAFERVHKKPVQQQAAYQQTVEPQPAYVMKEALTKFFPEEQTEEVMLMIDHFFNDSIVGKIKLSKAQELIKQTGTFEEFQERVKKCN